MNDQRDSNSASGAKSALQEGLARLSNIDFSFPLRERVASFMRWLTGVDADVLAQCSKSQQTLYSAIGIVMVLAALFTAAGVSAKLAGLWELGMLGRAGLFALMMALVLALEAAVLSSISPGANPLATLAVRVPIGLLLVCMQVTPTLTTMLQGQISLALAEEGLSKQVSLQTTSQKLRNVDGLRSTGKSLDDKYLQAVAEQLTPPADIDVNEAEKKLISANEIFKKAASKQQLARKRVNDLNGALAKAKDEQAVTRIQASLDTAKTSLTKANGEVNDTDVAVQNADTAVKSAKATQATALAKEVVNAKLKIDGHGETMAATQKSLDSDAVKAKSLADNATQANFITQVVGLAKLARNDWAIFFTCLVTIFGFALLDLLPTALKMSARNGLYARLVQLQDDEMRSSLQQAFNNAEQDRFQMSAIKINQTAGVRQFTQIDTGKLEAQRLLIDAQRGVDELQTTATLDLAQIALDKLAVLLETLIEQSKRLAECPEVAPAYRQQLDRLLNEMQERANAIADQLRGGPTAPQGA